MSCETNRWPPVYDFDSLKNEIKNLLERGLKDNFYKQYPDLSSLFQGDIIKIDMDFPYIDSNGDIVIISSNTWLILGNTCDIAREDLPFTNIIPLEELDQDVPKKIIENLKLFQNYKKIYFPDNTNKMPGYVADFTQICSIEKSFLLEKSKKISELEYHSWVLFHSCIVRYFARDDGRND